MGEGVQGQSPPEDKSISAFGCPTQAAKVAALFFAFCKMASQAPKSKRDRPPTLRGTETQWAGRSCSCPTNCRIGIGQTNTFCRTNISLIAYCKLAAQRSLLFMEIVATR